jgi:hypothetical protein
MSGQEYKWYTTNQTAWIPFSMAVRGYYTDSEKARALRVNPKKVFFAVPEGHNIYTKEIAILKAELERRNI